MIGPGGSGDALGTWLLLMVAGGVFGVGGGILAYTGRWRGWRRAEGPFGHAPLAAIPFGAGCLIEIATVVVRPPHPLDSVVAGILVGCALSTCGLFLRFPTMLKPAWLRALEAAEGQEPPTPAPEERGSRP
ncbi:MAG: hypothetical protein ACREPA_12255 [Candidatus Dormibacteraceae bacterium]